MPSALVSMFCLQFFCFSIAHANSDLCDRLLIERVQQIRSIPRIQIAFDELGRRYRSGWKARGIPDSLGETILAHSEKVFRAAMLYPVKNLNRQRMVLMAYFHDLAEFEVHDYTPHDLILPEEKHELERSAILKLIDSTGEDGELILNLWLEYEAQLTSESKLVYQLDKLDAAIQAFEYEKLGFDVSEFFTYTQQKISDPLLSHIFSSLLKRERPAQNSYLQYFEALSKSR